MTEQIKANEVTQEKPKYILSEENAKKEIDKILDYYEIDLETIKDKDLKKAIEISYDKAMNAIRRGRLKSEISDGGITIFQYRKNDVNRTDPLKYREIDGVAKSEMDSFPSDAFNQRAQALMGSLSGLGQHAIKQLKGVDYSLMECLGLIFLAV